MKPYRKPVIKFMLITGFYFFLQPYSLVAQTNYYISSKGNDNNNGLTKQTAWKSLKKVNSQSFKPGDNILIEANAVFKGTIIIASSGTIQQPIIFSSYGKGKTIIDAADQDGIKGFNVSNVHVNNLIVKGSGVTSNKGNGIHFYSGDTLNNPGNIIIDKCDVSGFHNKGIAVGCGEKDNIKGYRNVRITNCTATENGQAGIASYGSYTSFQNRNFYVGYCKAYNNRGIPGKTENHSGNGIVMGEVDSLLVEHCEAFENGADNSSEAGGPVGIWVWMCRNAIIQHCVSHHNHAGLTKDGGGFDIDGGASNCIIQYNYSYNNEGAGYLLAEYGALFPFTNNIIRFNISENDGRKNNYGGIGIWGADSNYKVTNSYIYNNTIYSDDKNVVNGTPSAITLMGPHFRNVIVANNIFALKGNTNFINADDTLDAKSLLLIFNNYYSYSQKYAFRFGNVIYTSLQQWLTTDTLQEKDAYKKLCYYNINPGFTGNVPGKKDKYYKLAKKSLLRNVASDISGIHGWSVRLPFQDYNRDDLTVTRSLIPGAFAK
jgi:Right handed beta helix region